MGSTLSYRPLPIRALRILITKEPTPLYCSLYAMLTTGEIDHLRWACQRSGGGIATVATRHFEWQNNPRVVCK